MALAVSQDGLVIQATQVYLALVATQVYQAGAVLQVTQAFLVPQAGLVFQALAYPATLALAVIPPRLKVQ